MSAEERLPPADGTIAEKLDHWFGTLNEDEHGLVRSTKAELRAMLDWHRIAVVEEAGVSVPIEPEAPDPLRDIEEAQERGYRYGYADGLASQPVPDPEPSARLREALEAWERNGAPNRKSLAAFGIRPTLAATPQDPEA